MTTPLGFKSESAAQLFARLGARRLGTYSLRFFADVPLIHGSLVEVCGADGVGKSQLLYHMAAYHVLQSSFGVPSTSSVTDPEVVFICTNCKFDAQRIADIMKEMFLTTFSNGSINQQNESIRFPSSFDVNTSPLTVSENICQALEKIKIFQCSSSSELICTLVYLREFIGEYPSVSLVLIDDIGAYYWRDRHEHSTTRASGNYYPEVILKSLSAAMGEIKQMHLVAVIVVKPSLLGSKQKSLSTSGSSSLPDLTSEDPVEYLGSSWQRLVTQRLTLTATERFISSDTLVQTRLSVPHIIDRQQKSLKQQNPVKAFSKHLLSNKNRLYVLFMNSRHYNFVILQEGIVCIDHI